MRRVTLSVLFTTTAWAAPDAIYIHGKIVTVDPRFTIAEAIAVTGGKFEAVGMNIDIQNLAGSTTRVIDLHGRTVVPGLEDSHLHNAGGGPGVDLSNAARSPTSWLQSASAPRPRRLARSSSLTATGTKRSSPSSDSPYAVISIRFLRTTQSSWSVAGTSTFSIPPRWPSGTSIKPPRRPRAGRSAAIPTVNRTVS